MIKASNSGARGAKFDKLGAVVGGTVVSVDVFQDRDDDNKLKFWDDGGPIMKCRVIVQTSLDEGEDDQGREDDGKRAIYVKTWGEQWKALKNALARTDSDDVVVGGKFYAKFKSEGEKIKKQWSAPKNMLYKYEPPANLPEGEDFEEDEAPAPPSRPTTRKPAAAPAAAPARGRGAKKPPPVDLDDVADPVDGTADALADAGLGEDDF
jgi:hypothetical protein